MNTLPPSSFFTELLEMDQRCEQRNCLGCNQHWELTRPVSAPKTSARLLSAASLALKKRTSHQASNSHRAWHDCNLAFLDDTCAICQETFLAIIATEEMASVMETPGLPEEDLGLVKLPGCGHRFCRKDIATWVYSSHSTCPACRNEFLPESMRQAVHDEPGLDSLLEARELIRLLQLRTTGLYDNADEAHHNPFNEGGAGVSAPSLDGEEREDLQRIVDQFHNVFGTPAPRRDDRDDYAGMYS